MLLEGVAAEPFAGGGIIIAVAEIVEPGFRIIIFRLETDGEGELRECGNASVTGLPYGA